MVDNDIGNHAGAVPAHGRYTEKGIRNMATDFRIRPLADRVVVKPVDREEKTKSGIFLPDTASKERPMEGTVLAVGEGRLDDNGRRVPMIVRAGDKVLFAKYGGTEYKIDDVEYLILAEKDILGIISE
jgi:chaperonin GroES